MAISLRHSLGRRGTSWQTVIFLVLTCVHSGIEWTCTPLSTAAEEPTIITTNSCLPRVKMGLSGPEALRAWFSPIALHFSVGATYGFAAKIEDDELGCWSSAYCGVTAFAIAFGQRVTGPYLSPTISIFILTIAARAKEPRPQSQTTPRVHKSRPYTILLHCVVHKTCGIIPEMNCDPKARASPEHAVGCICRV